jgi:hypothetical protein
MEPLEHAHIERPWSFPMADLTGDALADHPHPNTIDDFTDDENVLCVEAQIEPHNCSLMNRWPPEPRVQMGHREDTALHELRRATDG